MEPSESMTTRERRRKEIILESLRQFAERGFHKTTVPDIANSLNMSVGNFYNYFKSKEVLAQEVLKFISKHLGDKIRKVNESDISTEKKVHSIVSLYFETAIEQPEMIDYFLRVYLSNREVFQEECQGMACVSDFVTEIMIFFEEGVAKGDLKNQDFFSAFGLFMGYLGGMVFLNGESILPKPLKEYAGDVADNIYNALKLER